MLGDLSARYESSGDPGTVSSGYGDPGGKSYGLYQFSSNAGTLDEYIQWLQDNGYWFGAELAKHELTSEEFDAAWKWLANSDNRDVFADSQHLYTKQKFYDVAAAYLADNNWNIENHSEVMKDVLWSRAVQYGPGQIVDMWTEAVHAIGYPNLSYVDAANFDYDMIIAIYLKVCSSWDWNHSSLRDSLNNRFREECNEALSRL